MAEDRGPASAIGVQLNDSGWDALISYHIN
jgi:hypothetical protein